ncbi:rab protein geranylgeranyltransferase component A [Colletotrichum falcatum]|nr:rab protein geranylgeranyltransferase component A [Colletotrichum falcatum]
MESLAEQTWDVILHGTGLQQSLLALALSRSGKQILHLDPNEYYGGPEAAFGLQEIEEWAAAHADADGPGPARPFSSATVTKPEVAAGSGPSLSFPRAYSLALAPQIIHTRSELVKQLVSSRAFRQIEFLAVGSFFIYTPPSGASEDARASVVPIPSSREAVFSTTAISAKAKRSLMKFLKFVLDYNSEEQRGTWTPHADKPLSEFLASDFMLDAALQTYIVTLTLSLDGGVSTKDGLAAIHRHLSSMGAFGPGFAAVYPKWGGLSEIAQVGCRACAVGGAVYMLGTGVKATRPLDAQEDGARFELDLTSGVTMKSRTLVRGAQDVAPGSQRVSRTIAVVNSPLSSLFETRVEGAPTPAVAVVAIPAGSIDDVAFPYPIYAFAHSSETGECPSGQSVLYLVAPKTADSAEALEKALASLLSALGEGDGRPQVIYRVAYEQARAASSSAGADASDVLPGLPLDLAFSDAALEPVREAWTKLAGPGADDPDTQYMKFEDREGVDDEDDVYE